MNESNIPLLTDVVEEPDPSDSTADREVIEPETSEPIDIAFDDSPFRIDEDIIVFEADESRRFDWRMHYAPLAEAIAEPPRESAAPSAEPAVGGADASVWRIEIDELETIVAELQTRLASHTYELTDELMRTAFADFEARVFRQISTQLRELLPELIDSVVREHLLERGRDSGEGD